MEKYIFQKANNSLNEKHIRSKTNNFVRLLFLIAAILIFSSIYIMVNENLVLFLFEEHFKYESTRFIIGIFNGWSDNISNVTGYNSKDLNELYEYKKAIIQLELSIINLIYMTILAILFGEDSCKTK